MSPLLHVVSVPTVPAAGRVPKSVGAVPVVGRSAGGRNPNKSVVWPEARRSGPQRDRGDDRGQEQAGGSEMTIAEMTVANAYRGVPAAAMIHQEIHRAIANSSHERIPKKENQRDPTPADEPKSCDTLLLDRLLNCLSPRHHEQAQCRGAAGRTRQFNRVANLPPKATPIPLFCTSCCISRKA